MEEKHLQQGGAARRLYYEDSHLKEFRAAVLSCEKYKDGYRVELDRTAFFPEGGGQFGDRGWLDGIQVTDTREEDGVIWHMTAEAVPEGSEVLGRLDYAERFSRMQQHTGEHILSGLVHSLYGYDNVGFHLGQEATTLDFNGELSGEQILDLERRANQAVYEDIPVQVLYPDSEELKKLDYRSKIEIEGQVRLVSVPGYDICACCAPHVQRTGEIGVIKVQSCERHRGGCRVTIVCGDRALKDYQEKQRGVTDVSVALSARPDQIGEAVLRLKEQQEKLREHLNRMQALYLEEKLCRIRPDQRNVCIFEEDLDNIAVRNFINGAVERCPGICAAFVGTDNAGYRYILGSRNVDLRVFVKELNARFRGKGGGKPEMVQGSLTGTREEIEKMIMEG